MFKLEDRCRNTFTNAVKEVLFFWDYPTGAPRQLRLHRDRHPGFHLFDAGGEWFPRSSLASPGANTIAMLPDEHGGQMYWIDPDMLNGVPGGGNALSKVQPDFEKPGAEPPKPVLPACKPIYDEIGKNETEGVYVAYTNP